MILSIPQATKARDRAQARIRLAKAAGRPTTALSLALQRTIDELQGALWTAEVSASAIGGQRVAAA